VTAAVETRVSGLPAAEGVLAEQLVGRPLNSVETGMFTAMWSEHCAYKHSRDLLATLSSDGSRVLVGPGENAGALDIGDGWAVVFKVESHNHPSAVEPYQGAATGVGGIVRDIFTMGARPIALLNGLRFGPLIPAEDPSGRTDEAAAARNRWLFGGVVAGIAGYGNCLGIPDVGGELVFDPSYTGNPLVNALCVGLARHDDLVRARAAGAGNALMLVGSATGRDGIQGASFASATLGGDGAGDRPAVQVGNPFLEKLLLEACLALVGNPDVVAMQDLGAAGLTCALAEVTSRGECGADVALDLVPLREAGMTPYEILLSESQERMLLVVRAGGEERVAAAFSRFGLHATVIGRVSDEPMLRGRWHGELVCELPPAALTDQAPRYRPAAEPPVDLAARRARNLSALASAPATTEHLLRLLASANVRSRQSIWRRYDHMNGTRTVVPPGSDAALLRIEGTSRALALALDGPGRQAGLDPWQAAAAAVVEGALNVAALGAAPIGITNCLNFASPEDPAGFWQLREAVAGMAAACAALGLPIVSGNVSLYNQTDAGPILPAPVIGTIGLIEDRSDRLSPTWQSGQEVWLLGGHDVDGSSLAGSEHAYLTGEDGGQPSLDLPAAARLVDLVPLLAASGIITGAHDLARGGLAVAVARMAIASGIGLQLDLPDRTLPSASAFGELPGRLLVAVDPGRVIDLETSCRAVDVRAQRLGVAGGAVLRLGDIRLDLDVARAAWERGF
jgi:phosphoribosylformylglycinamidine synthase